MAKTTIPNTYEGQLTDPPVPRMALKQQGAGSMRSGALPLPPPTAPGVMPPEDSRLWLFVPKAVQRGESFIQDDTRDWFLERERKVPIAREYLDHPRWLTGKIAETMRGKVFNGQIISEVHMLARLDAGMPEYPAWVPVRLSVRQVQADTAFRLTKLARQVLLAKGRQAMEDFATRAPGQFIKFIGTTFVPKRIETEATVVPGGMDPETADALIAALSEELKRREDDMKLVTIQSGTDYEVVDAEAGLIAAARELHDASNVGRSVNFGERVRPATKGHHPQARFIDHSIGKIQGDPAAEPEIVDIINAEQDDEEPEWD